MSRPKNESGLSESHLEMVDRCIEILENKKEHHGHTMDTMFYKIKTESLRDVLKRIHFIRNDIRDEFKRNIIKAY